MSVFDSLLIGHLLGDFIFQTAWMAEGKKKKILPLVVHAVVYTLCIFVISFSFNKLTLIDFLIICASHVLIDSRKVTYWWISNIMRIQSADSDGSWITIIVDQIFHLMIFYFILL